MDRFRYIAAWGLLVALVTGGIVGPLAHRVQHGMERATGAKATCHPASVHHAETATLAADPGLKALECDLCATRLLVVLPDMTPASTARVAGTTRVTLRTHLAPVHVATDRTIRGPPSISEARLA
jgi:phage tail protein X